MLWADFDSSHEANLLWRSDGADDSPDAEQRADLVRHAVATALSAKQREVVEAYFFEGLSQGQIASQLGISQQVVQRRLYGVQRRGQRIGGALRKLRQALEPNLQP